MKQNLLGLACVALLAAQNAQAVAIVDIGNDAEYSYTWNTPYTLGHTFEVGNTVTFNALGLFDVVSATRSPLSTVHANAAGLLFSHEVGLWDSAGNLLVSAVVDNSDPTTSSANTYGRWVYQSVPSMTLQAGRYTIGALYLAESDPVMIQQTAINSLGVTYVVGQYANGATLTRPTGTYPLNEQQYFGPTLLQVPDGGVTAGLLGFALVGLDGIRRRFKV